MRLVAGSVHGILDENDPGPHEFFDSHFGGGIVTFNPKVIFRTEKGVNMWVGGLPNEFKDGAQPLTAIVETDWMPYTFAMS